MTITLETTPAEDAAIRFLVTRHNASLPPPRVPDDPESFVRRHVRQLLDRWLTEHHDARNSQRGALYERASTEDRAAVDAILAHYEAPAEPAEPADPSEPTEPIGDRPRRA